MLSPLVKNVQAAYLAEADFPAAAPFPFFLPLPDAAVADFPPSSSEAAEDADEAARDLELLREPRAAPPPEPDPESSESSSLRIGCLVFYHGRRFKPLATP